ncbi:hypothetical protein ACERII_23965 [Evansella sp. AB-rgal1]|uniref:hypothetical protein n=1 Tax=Evansella sp. AB-rgal1 TaxID=3242696 RepID=UPI00359E015C
MGVFDSLLGYVNCIHCKKQTSIEVQCKVEDFSMSIYHIGDYLGVEEKYSILDVYKYNECQFCKKQLNVYPVIKNGYLYGFSNENEYNVLSKIFPTDKNIQKITLYVDEKFIEDPDMIIAIFKEQLLSEPHKKDFHIQEKNIKIEKEIDNMVCRTSRKVKNFDNRPKVNDTVWFDNTKLYYDTWEYSDK